MVPLLLASTASAALRVSHGPRRAVTVPKLKLTAHKGSVMRPFCSGADSPEAEIALAEHV